VERADEAWLPGQSGTLVFRNPESSLAWLGAPSGVELHVEARSDDVVVIPDAAFLFNADFQRAGRDLVLTGEDGRRLIIEDYFAHDKRPALASRDGATVSAAAIEAIVKNTTPEQYAQAGTPQSAGSPIGRVEKVTGSAFVIRNGVAVELNVGDLVFKGDVVQTRSGSTLGIGFVDGTAFNLAANARMVLNEMVFDPNGTSNSALLTLIQGTISFAAGQVAKTGDMKVETPVATMGIRGTMVLVEIAADNGPTKFHVLREPDGTVGKVEIYSKTDSSLIATITNPDIKVEVTPPAPGRQHGAGRRRDGEDDRRAADRPGGRPAGRVRAGVVPVQSAHGRATGADGGKADR
jgi:hypothetical protein